MIWIFDIFHYTVTSTSSIFRMNFNEQTYPFVKDSFNNGKQKLNASSITACNFMIKFIHIQSEISSYIFCFTYAKEQFFSVMGMDCFANILAIIQQLSLGVSNLQ